MRTKYREDEARPSGTVVWELRAEKVTVETVEGTALEADPGGGGAAALPSLVVLRG